jgi:hypothetical protein
MSYTDAEWDEIESYSRPPPPGSPLREHVNFAAPTTPLSEYAATTESHVAPGALDTLSLAADRVPPVTSETTAVAAEHKPQQSKRAGAAGACACRHCGQQVFIILQNVGARCKDCDQRVRFVTQCAACRRPNCFMCWAAASARSAPQAAVPRAQVLPPDRAQCHACRIECKAASLPGHWRCATHFRQMSHYTQPERFCSNQCFYGGAAAHAWVTLERHIATARRAIPEPLRFDSCCSTCGGIRLA